jgi:hypothetical protein
MSVQFTHLVAIGAAIVVLAVMHDDTDELPLVAPLSRAPTFELNYWGMAEVGAPDDTARHGSIPSKIPSATQPLAYDYSEPDPKLRLSALDASIGTSSALGVASVAMVDLDEQIRARAAVLFELALARPPISQGQDR